MMNKKPHPNAEMLKAIANDISLNNKVEMFSEVEDRWIPVMGHVIISRPDKKYRFKPREFKEGYWYPVVTKQGEKRIMLHEEGRFMASNGNVTLVREKEFKFIGEGYLPDFGDSDE